MTPVTTSTPFVADLPISAKAPIPAPGRAENIALAREELRRFLALLDTLTPADWDRPTECALWSVKDIVAHQSCHVVALTHWRELIDQFNPMKLRDYTRRGMNLLDAANQRQVDKRAAWPPEALIEEIRQHSEASFVGRQHFPGWLRRLPVQTPGYDGLVSGGELIDVIFTRDMWMHRLDICRATNRDMVQSPEHDGRITALVVRDLRRRLAARLGKHTVLFQLTGAAGGDWAVGESDVSDAQVCMNVNDFHRLASGRIHSEQAQAEGLVRIGGDREPGLLALRHTTVLY